VIRRAALIAALTVLAACDGAPEPPLPEAAPPPAPVLEPVEGFAHEAGVELSGFYLPTSAVEVGDLRLSHLFIGDDDTFEALEAAGGRGPTNFPPILLQFDDLSSETIPNDLGGQTPSEIVRVLPDGYGVSARTVRFAALEPRLGVVTFEGMFVQQIDPAPTGRVLRGTLTIDGQIYEGQGFAWTAAP
jgi:hypothetical protein